MIWVSLENLEMQGLCSWTSQVQMLQQITVCAHAGNSPSACASNGTEQASNQQAVNTSLKILGTYRLTETAA
jgi:hypothetical protein